MDSNLSSFFSDFFRKIGETFVSELRQSVLKQKDIEGREYSRIKPSTAWNRVELLKQKRLKKHLSKGKTYSSFKNKKTDFVKGSEGHNVRSLTYPVGVKLTRLMNTKTFLSNAFQFRSTNKDVTIYVSENQYPVKDGTSAPVTYNQIVRWNDKNSAVVNRNIVRPPAIFPNTSLQRENMRSMAIANDLFVKAKREIGEIFARQFYTSEKISISA